MRFCTMLIRNALFTASGTILSINSTHIDV